MLDANKRIDAAGKYNVKLDFAMKLELDNSYKFIHLNH